jgi:hypothetical protein
VVGLDLRERSKQPSMWFMLSLIAVLSGISALTLWPMLKPDGRANVTDPHPTAAAACPACHCARDATDKFCRACGTRLGEEPPSLLRSLVDAVFKVALKVSVSEGLSVWSRTHGRHRDRYVGDKKAEGNRERKTAEAYSLVMTALLTLLLAASVSRVTPAAGPIAVTLALYRWLEILLGFVTGMLLNEGPLDSASVFNVAVAGVNLILIAAIATVVFLSDAHDWDSGRIPHGALNALYVSATNLVVLGNNAYAPRSDIARLIVAMTAISGVALLGVGLARAISALPRR